MNRSTAPLASNYELDTVVVNGTIDIAYLHRRVVVSGVLSCHQRALILSVSASHIWGLAQKLSVAGI